MQRVTVLNNQSLLDIAIQTTGKAENLLKIAMANNLVPTDKITPGTILEIPQDIEKDIDMVRYYDVNSTIPATLNKIAIAEKESCLTMLKNCFNG